MEEVGRIVPRALKTHVQRDKTPLLAVVTGLWPRVAGRAVAEQARPVAFASGALTLSTSSEAWAVQLQALSGEVCAAVNKALGQQLVKHLRVRVARRPGVEMITPLAKAKTPQLPAAAQGRAESHNDADSSPLAALDPETRKVLAHSFAKYFARAQQRIH